MANSHSPTYGLGFARNASESTHPELWRDLAGAWIPALGRTGSTLFDISGKHKHGTLTNMEPANDWIIGQRGYVLKFIGGGEGDKPHVSLGVLGVTEPATLWVRFKTDDAQNDKRLWGPAGQDGSVRFRTGGIQLWNPLANIVAASTISADTWYDLVIVFHPDTTATGWINGVKQLTVGAGHEFAFSTVIATLGTDDLSSFGGQIAACCLWHRELIPSQILDLSTTFLAPFQLRRRNVVAPAFTPISSGLDLFIAGPEIINNNIILTTKGHTSIPSGVDLFIVGNQGFSNDTTLFTSGVSVISTINASEDLVTIGHIPIESGIDLFVVGNDVISSGLDLFITGNNVINNNLTLLINGHTPIQSGLDLFTIGHIVKASDLNLFTKGKDTTSGNLDLSIIGHLRSSGNLDLVMPDTKDVIDSNITLFIGSFVTHSSDLDLFIPGKDNSSGNLDLITIGHISVLSDLNLFLAGIDISSGNLDLFIDGKNIFSGNLDLFISGKNIISSGLDLFTNGHISIASGLDLFIATKDIHSSGLDLFLKAEEVGSGIINDIITLVTFGKQLINNDLDLFAEGKISINANLDLFIGGKDSISGNLALVTLGHISTSDNIDLFTKGKTLVSEELELIISGHIVSSGNLDLLVKGKDSILSDITLFIGGVPGILTIESGIDLFTIGHTQIFDDTNLFISGHLSSSGDLDLILPDAKDIIDSNIALFIGSFPINISSLDLLIIGQDNSSGNLDLSILGKNIRFSDLDLFIDGHEFSSSNINLFTTSKDTISENLDLFIGTPGIPIESGQIVLCINGVIPRPILLCPSLDSTASIQISDELIGIYQSRIDALINQLGKNILLEFAKIKSPCPNCFFDTLRNRSNGIFRTGGPRPFTRGRRCPWCKGKGFEEIDNNKCIKALLKWTPKDAKKYGIDLRIHKGVVRIKTFLTELDDLVRAETMIANHDIKDIIRLRVKLIRNPIPVGLREDRYCISFWAL